MRELGLDRANAYFTHVDDTSGAADEAAGEVREGVPRESGWWTLPLNYLTGALVGLRQFLSVNDPESGAQSGRTPLPNRAAGRRDAT